MNIDLYIDRNYAQTPGSISDDAKRIRVRAKVTTPNGAAVAGVKVSFALHPRKDSFHFYQEDLTEIGGTPVVVTDKTGTASLYIVSDGPGYASILASLYDGPSSASYELYFGSIDGAALQSTWLPPSVITTASWPHVATMTTPIPRGFRSAVAVPPTGDMVEIQKSTGEAPVFGRTFAVSVPLQSTKISDTNSVSFLVVNNLAAIPCKPSVDMSGRGSKVAVAYSDLVLSPRLDSNTIAYFVQDENGTIGQSPTIGFQGVGIYQNEPDPTQTARFTPAPQVTPDPGSSGIITINTLKPNHGLRVSIPSFDTKLLDRTGGIKQLRCEIYFYMNGYYEGTNDVRPGRMFPVSVGSLEIVDTTVSSFSATLDWSYAYGWARPLNGTPSNFYCEYLLRDDSDRLYISNTCSNQGTPWLLDTAGHV